MTGVLFARTAPQIARTLASILHREICWPNQRIPLDDRRFICKNGTHKTQWCCTTFYMEKYASQPREFHDSVSQHSPHWKALAIPKTHTNQNCIHNQEFINNFAGSFGNNCSPTQEKRVDKQLMHSRINPRESATRIHTKLNISHNSKHS